MSTKANLKNIYNLTRIAVCIALLCVSSYLVFPLPFTPTVISLHTAVVNLIGLVLNPKQAGTTILVYLLMGIIGLPVLSVGTGGIGKLLGPTGGYYFGFLLAAVVISLMRGSNNQLWRYILITVGVGLPIQHICAIAMMAFHNGGNVGAAFLTVSLPFFLGDIMKCVMASVVGLAINKYIQPK